MNIFLTIWKWLSSQVTAYPYYNPTTDTIHNCEEYSWAWFHEMRHRKQSYAFPWIKFIMETCFCYGYYVAGMLSVALFFWGESGLIFKTIGLIMSPYILILSLMETDAFLIGTIQYLIYKMEKK